MLAYIKRISLLVQKFFTRRVRRLIGRSVFGLLGVWVLSVVILLALLLVQVNNLRRLAADPAHVSLASITPPLHAIYREYSLLHADLAPVLWLTSLFKGDLSAVRPLSNAGLQLLSAADHTLIALSPSVGDLQLSSLSMAELPPLLDALASSNSALQQASLHADSASAALQTIKGPLSPRVASLTSQAGKGIRLAQLAFQAAQIAPGLLGQSGSRQYLLLFQNSDELRATGGFIGNAGLVTLTNGKLGTMTVKDSYAFEDFTQYHPDPPQALYDYMRAEQWVFRDANWSPDFPTSAQDAIRLYNVSNADHVDGVIGITTQGVEFFIAALQPLTVPDLPEPVTAANFTKLSQETWNPPPDLGDSSAELGNWWRNRKQAMSQVMQAALVKITSGKVNWPSLALKVLDAFDQRQLMIYSSTEADALSRLQWDGSVQSVKGDYLMVVDSNVGFNKVNPLIHETVTDHITLQDDGSARVVVTLQYAHQGKQSGIPCVQFKLFDKTVTYDKMANSCYFDYLRLLLPSGARLINAAPKPVPAKYLLAGVPVTGKAHLLEDETLNHAVLSQFFVLEYAKKTAVRFEYSLPSVVSAAPHQQKQYTLFLQKQSGTDAIPVKVTVTLPPLSHFVSSSFVPVSIEGNTVVFSIPLATDQQLTLVYQPSR